MLIAVGSLNPVKRAAVQDVLTRLDITFTLQALEVPSGVPEQPIGLDETTQGALTRARNVRQALGADLGVGLEGGVEFDSTGQAWLFSVVAVVAEAPWESTARGGMLLLPPVVGAALRKGAELGPVIDDLFGLQQVKHGAGAIGMLTAGLISREASFRDSVARAFAPLLSPGLYGWPEQFSLNQ